MGGEGGRGGPSLGRWDARRLGGFVPPPAANCSLEFSPAPAAHREAAIRQVYVRGPGQQLVVVVLVAHNVHLHSRGGEESRGLFNIRFVCLLS